MMIMVMHCLLFHPCSILDRVRQYLDIWHNNTTHIFSDAAHGNLIERGTLLTWECLLLFFYTKKMWYHRILIGIKNTTYHLTRPSVVNCEYGI